MRPFEDARDSAGGQPRPTAFERQLRSVAGQGADLDGGDCAPISPSKTLPTQQGSTCTACVGRTYGILLRRGEHGEHEHSLNRRHGAS